MVPEGSGARNSFEMTSALQRFSLFVHGECLGGITNCLGVGNAQRIKFDDTDANFGLCDRTGYGSLMTLPSISSTDPARITHVVASSACCQAVGISHVA